MHGASRASPHAVTEYYLLISQQRDANAWTQAAQRNTGDMPSSCQHLMLSSSSSLQCDSTSSLTRDLHCYRQISVQGSGNDGSAQLQFSSSVYSLTCFRYFDSFVVCEIHYITLWARCCFFKAFISPPTAARNRLNGNTNQQSNECAL